MRGEIDVKHLTNTLKMLWILRKNQVIKCKDIAKELEISETQVRRYKSVLDNFFEIESIAGKYGGYKLSPTMYFPFKEILTEHETLMLKEFISGLDNYLIDNNHEISKAIDKINYTIINNDRECCDQIIPYSRAKPLDENALKISEDIYSSILDTNQIIISYKDNAGKVSDRKVEPYKFITYKGEKYLVAFCLLRNEMRYFKVKRIISCICTSISFKRSIDINKFIEEYRENSIGIFGGKEYRLKLEIKYPMANTIKERIWVENQIIDDISYNDRIIFKATMTGGPEIESWILSMGSCVKVIEPIELKNIISNKLEEMIKNI